MTPLQALIHARALIAEPERWTQRAAARRTSGSSTYPQDSAAVCWCSIGALYKAAGCHGLYSDGLHELGRSIRPLDEWPGDFVSEWNDAPERTHAEVLEAFDAAIARMEAQQ